MLVDAINEQAHTFYEQYGLVEFAGSQNRLFPPMKTILIFETNSPACSASVKARELADAKCLQQSNIFSGLALVSDS